MGAVGVLKGRVGRTAMTGTPGGTALATDRRRFKDLFGQAVGIRETAVSKTYQMGKVKVQALQNISLEIAPGEFAAILGPSGCGKSTLLSLLAGLDRPSEGHVYAAGEALDEIGESRLDDYRLRRVGTVFQSFNLVPSLTALENVALPMTLAGVPPAARRERAMRLLRLVDMHDRARFKPNRLSGGEQQRLAVARAVANGPGLILADEPTGNLDSKNGRRLMDLLLDLNRRGATLVLVTHDPNLAACADRVIHMQDGAIVDDPGGRRTLRLQCNLEPAQRMNWRAALLEGLRSLSNKPLRSLLTVIGVAIGVAAMAMILALASELGRESGGQLSIATLTTIRQAMVGLGGVGLLVAGLGIVNTMYAAVVERTREIGVLKALGARSRDVLLMFLGQASAIGLAGGVVGVLVSLAGGNLLNRSAGGQNLFKLDPIVVGGAIVVACAVSTLSGLLPALWAARQDPAVALRHS
jgi:ABC-type lipoprotein export system ATPase subunit